MNGLKSFFHGYEYFILVYFSLLSLFYAVSGYLGLRSVIVYARELSQVALRDLMERDHYKPVSILVPAYNEQESIVGSLRSLLDLHHPEFEVCVTNDGSTDATLDLLVENFALVEVPEVYRQTVTTKPVRRVFRSLAYPNLVVVDKENGGKPDAVNAAFNLGKFPLVCVVDADSMLDAKALIRASRLFIEDDSVVAVGGTLRPLNGAVVKDGRVAELHAPARWIERIQVLEYARAFFAARAAWSRFNCLMIISGAFGIFRRQAVLEVGGWWADTVAEDMEMVVKLHRHARERGKPCRMVFTPDPICWTQIPSTFAGLAGQRAGWHRGLWEVIWQHRVMLLNPRYGRVGMVGVPYLWFFEGLAAPLEAFGYLYIFATALLGMLNVPFALLFFALTVFYAILLSELAMGIESLLLARYSRPSDRLGLLAAGFVEFLGIRQLIALRRAWDTFAWPFKRGRYWKRERTGIATGPAVPAAAGADA